MYCCKYCIQVDPEGGSRDTYSTVAQVTCCLPSAIYQCQKMQTVKDVTKRSPCPTTPSTSHLYGVTYHIHCHHPRALNGCRTPLLVEKPVSKSNGSIICRTHKVRTKENSTLNIIAAILALGAMAATACPIVV